MAIIGYGSKLEVDPGTGTFVVVALSSMLNIPKSSVNMIDSSDLNVASRVRTFVPGLIDAGEADFEVQYSKATLTQLKAIEGVASVGGTPTPVKWRMTMPDEDGAGAITAVTLTFPGTLTSLEMDVKVEEIMILKGKIKVTGLVVIA